MAFPLQPRDAGDEFVGYCARIFLAVGVVILMMSIVLTHSVVAPARHLSDELRGTSSSPMASVSDDASDTTLQDDRGVLDLYGNEVTDAVARYKIDAAGTLYETHSPQTEVPRLGSPKS